MGKNWNRKAQPMDAIPIIEEEKNIKQLEDGVYIVGEQKKASTEFSELRNLYRESEMENIDLPPLSENINVTESVVEKLLNNSALEEMNRINGNPVPMKKTSKEAKINDTATKKESESFSEYFSDNNNWEKFKHTPHIYNALEQNSRKVEIRDCGCDETEFCINCVKPAALVKESKSHKRACNNVDMTMQFLVKKTVKKEMKKVLLKLLKKYL